MYHYVILFATCIALKNKQHFQGLYMAVYCFGNISSTPARRPFRCLSLLSLQVPNGIDSIIFQDGENRPDLFVYGSAPNRGLSGGERVYVRQVLGAAIAEQARRTATNSLQLGRSFDWYYGRVLVEQIVAPDLE